MTGITAPGIFFDMSVDDYSADPCPTPSLTQSVSKVLIEQSPLHAKQSHLHLATSVVADEEETVEKYDKAKAIGNAAHAIMLQRGKSMGIVNAPNFTTKEARKARDEARERGQEPILLKHYNAAHAMTLAAKLQLMRIEGCERAFIEGDGEVVAACMDGDLWLRTMIDWITPDLREVWDYKTTGLSAAPWLAGKKMAGDGWDVQAAMIERILDAIDPDGAGRRVFRFVCQENEDPYSLTVSELGEAPLTMGRKKLQYAIDRWKECIATDHWPAYPQRIIRPEYPAYAENAWMEREISEYEERQLPQVRSPMLSSLAGG